MSRAPTRKDLCGWLHRDAQELTPRIIEDQSIPHVTTMDNQTMGILSSGLSFREDTPPVILTDALLSLMPSWTRGKQGIGDCVSFGWELGGTALQAVQIVLHRQPWLWKGPFATEPIYGGSRVEALGKRTGGYSDGSTGGAAAKWVTTKGGMLLRQNYSIVTGSPDDDLTSYSADKAKQWGNFGCGGRDDNGVLDKVAMEHPIREAKLVTTFEQAATSIANGYPVVVCSSAGFGDRGRDGFVRWTTTWYHCMVFLGVRFDIPGLLLCNSWGNSWGASNPHYPARLPDAVKKCSAWVHARDVDKMLGDWKDSFAISSLEGWKRQEINWSETFHNIFLGA